MTVDLTPIEIREAIAAYLRTKGFLVKPDFQGKFFNGNRSNYSVDSHIQMHTSCSFGSDLTGATAEVEVIEVETPNPYRSPG